PFDAALSQVRAKLGLSYPLYIDGKPRKAKAGTFADTCPADTQIILGHFQSGDRADVQKAVAAAKSAFPAWRDLGWQQRITRLRQAADLMTQRQFEFAALLSLEVGKNRFEAIAEVSEAIDLILYYCRQMEEHNGYEVPLAGVGAEKTRS